MPQATEVIQEAETGREPAGVKLPSVTVTKPDPGLPPAPTHSALARLPAEDLRAILSAFPDHDPLLNYNRLHAAAKAQNPRLSETVEAFKARLEQLPASKLLAEIKALEALERDTLRSKLEMYSYLEETAKSKDFTATREHLISTLKPANSAKLTGDLIRIFTDHHQGDSRAHIGMVKALTGDEMQQFCALLKDVYRLAPESDLPGVLSLLQIPTAYERIRSADGQAIAGMAARAGVPVTNANDLQYLWLLGFGSLTDATRANTSPDLTSASINRAQRHLDVLKKTFGDRARPQNLRDFTSVAFLETNNPDEHVELKEADDKLKALGRPDGAFASVAELAKWQDRSDASPIHELTQALRVIETYGISPAALSFDGLRAMSVTLGLNAPDDKPLHQMTESRSKVSRIVRENYSDSFRTNDDFVALRVAAVSPEAFLDSFALHQKMLTKFGLPGPAKFTDVALCGESMRAIYSELLERDVRGFQLNPNARHFGLPEDPASRDRFLAALKDGSFEAVLNTLADTWGMKTVSTDALSQMFANDMAVDFIRDKEQGGRLRSMLSALGYEGPIRLESLITCGPEITAHWSAFQDSANVERMRLAPKATFGTLHQDTFQTVEDPLWQIYSLVTGPILSQGKEIDVALRSIEQLGVSKEDGMPFVLHAFSHSSSGGHLIQSLSRPEMKEALSFVRRYFSEHRQNTINGPKPYDVEEFLTLASFVCGQDLKECEKMLDKLSGLGLFPKLHGVPPSEDLSVIFRSKELTRTLMNDDFYPFEQKVKTQFFPTQDRRDVYHLTRVARAHELFRAHPEYEAVLDEPVRLQEVRGLLIQELNVQFDDPSSLQLLCHVAAGLDQRKFLDVIKAFRASTERGSERISGRDAVLLSEISKHDELFNLFIDSGKFNRAALLPQVRALYDRLPPPVVRQYDIKGIEAAGAKLEKDLLSGAGSEPTDETKQVLESVKRSTRSETDRYLTEFGGRPNPEQLSATGLARVLLLGGYFDQSNTEAMHALGRIVSADVIDKTTEHGGVIRWDRAKLSMTPLQSFSHDDGSYESNESAYVSDGIASFHLHALTVDESDFAGPSGLREGNVADAGYVRAGAGTDVVVTTLGHPKRNGAEDTSTVLVNLDLYYPDSLGKIVLVDLGTREVPYDKRD